MITIISLILVVVGALNWLTVGIFDFNLVNWIFTPGGYVGARVIYSLVGIAGLWLVAYLVYNKFNPRKVGAMEEKIFPMSKHATSMEVADEENACRCHNNLRELENRNHRNENF